MIDSKIYQAFKGIIVHSKNETEWEIFNPGVLICDENGIICDISHSVNFEKFPSIIIHDYKNKIICPGFIDCHVHMPQYAFVGVGADELLEWLEKYTFPSEARFADQDFARSGAAVFFNELLAYGTTCAAVYPTVHKKATDIAFGYAAHLGLRLIMGKVLMDQESPHFLLEDTEQGIDDSIELIEKWNGFDNGRIQYALTPRFAITCSEKSMKAISDTARKYNTYIQSHLAENKNEINYVKHLFPNHLSYTALYENCGLLTAKTLMAHCIYLTDLEQETLKKYNTVPVHCPTSNRFLQSGIYPIRKRQKSGLLTALGSDVAGGYELSMLHEMKEAIEMSKMYKIVNPDSKDKVLSMPEAFYLATLGAANALGLGHKIGNFELSKEADFLILDDNSINPFADFNFYQDIDHRMSRLLYRASKNCVEAVFIKGKRLK